MSPRLRADRLLVERGLFESRAKAQAAIEAGLVTADDQPVRKASDAIAADARIAAAPAHPWVSRGGVKLAAALDRLGLDVAGRVCLDVGASTGGFTEVLVRRGARRVHAVDVGRDQLHQSLRHHPAVVSIEETDIRSLDPGRLAEAPDLVVADVSFISLRHVLPAALALAAPHADLVVLVKPQFEAPRSAIRKGIVRDAAVHRAVCDDMAAFITSLHCTVTDAFAAAITGHDGNQEFFIGARRD